MDALLLSLTGPAEFSSIPAGQHETSAVQHLRGLLNALYRISTGSIPRTLADAGIRQEELDAVTDAFTKDENAQNFNAVLTHSFTGQPFQVA